jgi:hypothetical protein
MSALVAWLFHLTDCVVAIGTFVCLGYAIFGWDPDGRWVAAGAVIGLFLAPTGTGFKNLLRSKS